MKMTLILQLLMANLLPSLVLSDPCELPLDRAENEVTVPEDGLTIRWRVDQVDETIDILLTSSSLSNDNAWFAFGLSESGGMVGADIFSVEFSASRETSIVDRYVPWVASPLEETPLPYPVSDVTQDWELMCSDNTPGLTTALVRRKWNTHDEQDRPFVTGGMSVIYAWGGGSLGYHGSNRGSLSVDFFGGTASSSGGSFIPPGDSDASFVEGFYPGYDLQAVTTQYVCQVHDVGTDIRHVVAIEQVYTEAVYAPYVHHVLVHACGNDLNALHNMNLYEDTSLPCQSTNPLAQGNSPSGTGACTSILYGGAVGGDPFILPTEAGLLLGEDVRYIVVEAHFDNPNHDTGGAAVTDIIRFHTTSTLRPYHAGSMVVGDPAIFLDVIPSDVTEEHFETTCPSQCTESFVEDRKVFSSFLHMHQVGRTIWTSLLKYDPADGTTLLSKHVFDFREFWNFGFQQLTLVDVTLSPGDQINTHCIYDTTKSGGEVAFGSSSSEEMCMSFLFYYPYQPTDGYFCGYIAPDKSMCGQVGSDNFEVLSGANPVPDGDISLPDELYVSYIDDGGGDGDGDGDGGTNGDGDNNNESASGNGVILLVSGVAFLMVVAAAVGLFYYNRNQKDFFILSKDSTGKDTGMDTDRDDMVLFEDHNSSSQQSVELAGRLSLRQKEVY